ncbi:hypothetical protein HS1genome_0688 [Sulfodiicoccus acidiphilus]|uniref:Uncharacterized protein n=1 Tax=Sulfodiicoccus acidiphilus TaxID=1670455 RepID=A0A348B297_9CREN|nr:IS200/IS605 family accessory protein TnpB-related protein [Sulfodiicoccus acidiphilus]BBD72299.1 hypothetical protein HS1genome_0688 [Sulfodiicoccus acidiphilus]GGT90437.1 hypothetical protein GCM10007116_05320 [Sulfodiicoccus acidiphilus]
MIKEIRHKYFGIRKKLQEKRRLDVMKRLRGKESETVNHELHVVSKKIVEYAKQFPSPVIVVEKLTGIRENFKESKKLDRRFHSLPFRKLQNNDKVQSEDQRYKSGIH